MTAVLSNLGRIGGPIAGSAAGTPFALCAVGHGTAGLVAGGLIVATTMTIATAVPELFWLLALVIAVRERRKSLSGPNCVTAAQRRREIARDPAVEIAWARAAASSGQRGRGISRSAGQHNDQA